ncbi:MAG: hypothetical protein DRP15_02710 [Candidatus Aenigmatarchaeota archaeon]|nr:MAG: hypothetical protein DRP15_02710 [Candidatus Aenigmarchaeota archaeon]
MTDLTKFFEYSYEKPKQVKAEQIFNKVRAWDYVPSPKCIQMTFHCSHNTAVKVFNSLLFQEAKKGNWQYNEKIVFYIKDRIDKIRSLRLLNQKLAQQLLAGLRNWFPPIRRRQF